ncbi:hypothetical protein DW888_19005 [Bacteroides nordii]|uniref:Uncharacterized protein n=1 Tax=Bacteroides nordii TaxID=291645 RepID=A0A413V9R6_9BACE|nr:hypothetical protein DW888_19005 [Bacteroides nordii]
MQQQKSYWNIKKDRLINNRSSLYDTVIETQKLADSRKAYHRSSIAQPFNLRKSAIICVSIKRCHIV